MPKSRAWLILTLVCIHKNKPSGVERYRAHFRGEGKVSLGSRLVYRAHAHRSTTSLERSPIVSIHAIRVTVRSQLLIQIHVVVCVLFVRKDSYATHVA